MRNITVHKIYTQSKVKREALKNSHTFLLKRVHTIYFSVQPFFAVFFSSTLSSSVFLVFFSFYIFFYLFIYFFFFLILGCSQHPILNYSSTKKKSKTWLCRWAQSERRKYLGAFTLVVECRMCMSVSVWMYVWNLKERHH